MAYRRNKPEYQCYVLCLSQSTVHTGPHFGGAETAGTYPGRRRGGRVQQVIIEKETTNRDGETPCLGSGYNLPGPRIGIALMESWATRCHH